MRVLASLEVTLLGRDPAWVAFVLAVPILMFVALAALMGDSSDPVLYRGIGASDFYGTAIVVVAVCAATLVVLPHHVAAQRASGMLRRYEASGVTGPRLLAEQVGATALLAGVSGLAAAVIVSPFRNGDLPVATGQAVVASLATAATFAAFGVVLGALSSSPRQARMVGTGFWLTLVGLGVTALPSATWNGAVGRLQRIAPSWHAVRATHDAWFGLDAGLSWLVLLALLLLAAGSAMLAFRLE